MFRKSHPEYEFECMQVSEIKKDAIATYNMNFGERIVPCGVETLKNLPKFDILCAGFPCQPFSSAGKKEGFADKKRGNLIYEVLRICKESEPEFLILENVEHLTKMEKGRVLERILREFETLGYNVVWKLINATEVGLAQERTRLFILGSRSRNFTIKLNSYEPQYVRDIIDKLDKKSHILPSFLEKLSRFPAEYLIGKSVKDKRGGEQNIHSWDLDFHGTTNARQKELLNLLLRERRKKKWAALKNMKWMDGIPLSLTDIKTFYDYAELEEDVADLVAKKYLVKEHPKDLIDGKRVQNTSIEIGYNIAKGKLSFPISNILHPDKTTPTLTATDSSKLAVCFDNVVRQLNDTELKRLCGFPESFLIPEHVNQYDLFGNMVCPPIVCELLRCILINV